MMPQSTFMVSSAVAPGRLRELRELLASMTTVGGLADPDNALIPFGEYEQLHMARFFIAESITDGDTQVYEQRAGEWPPTLVFLGECDGSEENFLARMVADHEPALRLIFSCCKDLSADGDSLLEWMRKHRSHPAASYVNWLGRTVVQVREEFALHKALSQRLRELVSQIDKADARALRQKLLSFVALETYHGRLTLTPPPPTPFAWAMRNYLHLIGVPLLLLLISPLMILAAPIVVIWLRTLEATDPEIHPKYDGSHIDRLASHEDFDVSNQFSAFGLLKPGRFRRYVAMFVLLLIDYAARHVYKRGFLARVRSIHFARWVFMDGRKRMLFISNYDGSHEAYMDDFINKVAWGLNLIFSNGVGWPRTRWLFKGGAEQELKFKYYQRRHQLHTDVWYKACPGLTAVDLEHNSRIRDGVEHRQETDEEIRAWLRLIRM